MEFEEFKCPNCGGPIQYKPGTKELACPYCESFIDIQAIKNHNETDTPETEQETTSPAWSYQKSHWDDNEQQDLVVYSCRSCGGEIVGDKTLGATTCPFCGSPVVITPTFAGSFRPDLVIPFKISRDQALKGLQHHYLGKRLAPKAFKEQNHLEEIKGVYVPFWLFCAEAEGVFEYLGTKIRHWQDRNYRYTETSHYRIIREGSLGFTDVPADGSSAIDDLLMQSIEPFDMKEAVDFTTPYLAGFFANKYDVEADQCMDLVNQRIRSSTETIFRNTVKGYASVTPRKSRIGLHNQKIRYALLPVWLLTTTWQGKTFVFAMNGQTGKFIGDLPLDKQAFWQWFGKLFGISAAVLLTIALIIEGII